MKQKHKNGAGVKSLLTGTAAGAVIFLLASMITALILTKSDLSYQTIRFICFATTAVSGFVSGFVGRRGAPIKGILAGAVSSTALTVLILVSVLAVNGLACTEEVLLLVPVGVCFGMAGGIISSNLR